MTNAAWLATPSVRINPSSQRASNGSDFSVSFGNSPLWSGARPCATARLAEQYEQEQTQLVGQVETLTGNMQQLGAHVTTLTNAYEDLLKNVNEMDVSNAVVRDLNELFR